jgi:hypothetical protein
MATLQNIGSKKCSLLCYLMKMVDVNNVVESMRTMALKRELSKFSKCAGNLTAEAWARTRKARKRNNS